MPQRGMGAHRMNMPMRSGPDFTPGWSLMTRTEREEHRKQMREMKTHAECMSYMEQHHTQMTERAKEKGVKAPGPARRDACAGLKP
jgi:hypothetical protein